MAGAQKKRKLKQRQNPSNISNSDDKSKSTTSSDAKSPKSSVSPPVPVDGNRDPSRPRSRASSTGSQSGRSQGGQTQEQQGSSQSAVFRPPIEANKNLDAGAIAAFRLAGLTTPNLPKKPDSGNRSGREVNIILNTFPILKLPTKPIFQYDVVVGNGNEKRGLIKEVWKSNAVKNDLFKNGHETLHKWIFDGNRLAWSIDGSRERKNISVDLDRERGVQPGEGKDPNFHRITVVQVKKLDFAPLEAYLRGQADWSDEAYEALNFLDHLLRQTPSERYIQIKRNFFARGDERKMLSHHLELFKGTYVSVRPVSKGFGQPGGLSVNVDVANSAFWCEIPLHASAIHIVNARDLSHLRNMLRAGEQDNSRNQNFLMMKRLTKLKVTQRHLAGRRPKTIEKIVNESAMTHRFDWENKSTGKTRKVTVFEYFREHYNIRLEHPDLPLVKFQGSSGLVPMEVCQIEPNQQYKVKLSDRQTAEMIKHAVTPPDVRWQEGVKHGLTKLDWPNDPTLKEYGMEISQQATNVKARILPNPKVQFGANSQQNPVDPRTSGRWDLRGKKFIQPHKMPLNAWGVCILTIGRFAAKKEDVQKFLKVFITTFQGHGGRVSNTNPTIIECGDPAQAVEQLFNKVGVEAKNPPQILFFILPERDTPTYQRIKRSTDCRYGVVSQILQAAHVQKAQQQYCSNVSMKVNAKLGGWTTQAVGMKGTSSWFGKPTMVVGADVTHGAPGSSSGSIAAITMSWDRNAIKYIAGVESNGARNEIIQAEVFNTVMTPMVKNWITIVAGGMFPQHIIYVRDGVSEGEYPRILNGELSSMRAVLRALDPKAAANTKFTVVVGTKRHHIRFFPNKGEGDKNNNALPGTLVETGVTSPFLFDFYLCSHSAIKGTARPVYYNVLLDEEKMKPAELQQWIYESSYQYVRSTTPVSLFPAAYYAHLAADRAVSHDRDFNPSATGGTVKSESSGEKTEDIKPLTPMPATHAIQGTMWFV